MRFTVQPNCYSVKLPNGKVYPVDKKGHVTVNDPRDAKLVAESHTIKELGYIEREYVAMGVAQDGTYCPKCMFHAYAWSTTCPRCGADLK